MLMPDAGVGAQQDPLAEGDLFLAAAGQGAHDRGAAADVGAVAGDDAGGDAALHHGRAQGSGVEVHEAFVHDRGAFGQVRTEADAVGVGNPDAGGDHVVHHARELVHAVDGDGAARRSRARVSSKPSTAAGPKLVHTTLGSLPKMPSRLMLLGWTSRCESRCRRR